MVNPVKALAVGNYEKPEWHPFTNADKALTSILAEDAEVSCTENFDEFSARNLQTYDLVISYVDRFKGRLTDEQTAGLLAYVACGGAFVAIHNGISLQTRYELNHMIGGKFTGHPPYRELTITIKAPGHEIMRGTDSFVIHDEPYQFEFTPGVEKTVLMEYEMDGQTYPAGWVHEYGMGRVVYLMPGHDTKPFELPMYRKIIRQSCKWAVRG